MNISARLHRNQIHLRCSIEVFSHTAASGLRFYCTKGFIFLLPQLKSFQAFRLGAAQVNETKQLKEYLWFGF